MVPPDGVPRRYMALEGESLMTVLKRNKTPGFYPDCKGGDPEHTMAAHQVPYDYYSMGVSCGQCHVMVSDPHFDKLNPKPSTEQRCLDRAASTTAENSRLACCVQIRPELNEMVVVVGDNRSVDSDWFSGKDGSAF